MHLFSNIKNSPISKKHLAAFFTDRFKKSESEELVENDDGEDFNRLIHPAELEELVISIIAGPTTISEDEDRQASARYYISLLRSQDRSILSDSIGEPPIFISPANRNSSSQTRYVALMKNIIFA